MLSPLRQIRSAAVVLALTVVAFVSLLAGCRSPDSPPPAMQLHAAPASRETAKPTPARSPAPQPERQIYLADGGAGLLVLESSTTGTEVVDGWWELSEPDVRWTAELETTGPEKLLRVQTVMYYREVSDWVGNVLVFRPSTARPADWDLIFLDGAANLKPGSPIAVPDSLPPVPPVSGFLHRIDDARAVDYFRLAAASDPLSTLPQSGFPPPPLPGTPGTTVAEELLRLARELTAAHPDDLYARYLLLDALLRCEKLGELAAELLLFEAQAARSGDRLLVSRGRQVRRQLRARELEESGLNGRRAMEKFLTATTRPDERLRLAHDLFRYEDSVTTVPTLVYPAWNRVHRRNLLMEQVVCKVNRVYADFCMLTGQRDAARTLLVGMYRAAQLYGQEQDPWVIRQLMAVAMRSITSAGLQTLAANACLTSVEAQALRQDLELLNLHEREFACDNELLRLSVVNEREARVRHAVGAAKFQLVRMTLASRWHQMAAGRLPISASQITPLFPAGLPRDPFTSAPLRVEASQEGVNLYSLGPDRVDQFAAVDYDPTNGTISTGDIIARVPTVREYPFPAEGMRAWSVQDVARQFPKGLPPDPFADSRGRGYTVTSGPGPVIVYSFGPDTDQEKVFHYGDRHPLAHLSQASHVPTTVYDPTNGVVSRGDIFVELPPGGAAVR